MDNRVKKPASPTHARMRIGTGEQELIFSWESTSPEVKPQRGTRPPSSLQQKTVLNLLGTPPFKLTFTPPSPSRLQRESPPVLDLLTTSPAPQEDTSSVKFSRSRSLSPTHSRRRDRRRSSQPILPQSQTVLHLLRASTHLQLELSPPQQPQASPQTTLPPPLLLPPTSHYPEQFRQESTPGTSEAIQIILPGDQNEWKLEVEEVQQSLLQNNQPNLAELRKAATRLSQSPTSENNEYYRELLQDFAYHLLLIALVSPNAMNAFCEPSGVRPPDITLIWWKSLSPNIQFLSLLNAVFSTGVNVFVQRDFIPQALKELRDSFKKCFNSPGDFLDNSLTLVSSSTAAFAFAAMSYEAFKWIGDLASVLPGVASLLTSFTTRYPSVKKAKNKFLSAFDPDLRKQKKMADQLRHLRPTYTNAVRDLIRTEHLNLNNKSLLCLLDKLLSEAEGIPQGKVLLPKKPQEYLEEYFLFAVQASFTTVISSAAFLTFTQKGFDGVNAIAHLLGSNLDDLSRSEQFGMGVVGGAVSAMLYAQASLTFLPTAYYVGTELLWDIMSASKRLALHPRDTLKKTAENPQRFYRFLKLALSTVAVWRSSGAMNTVGKGVVSNKKGIFFPLFEYLPYLKDHFALLNSIGGDAINGTSTANQILKKEREEKKKNPELEDFIRHLEEIPLPDLMELNPGESPSQTVPTLPYLSGFSLFKPTPAVRRAQYIEMQEFPHEEYEADEPLNLETLPFLESPEGRNPDLEEQSPPKPPSNSVWNWLKLR